MLPTLNSEEAKFIVGYKRLGRQLYQLAADMQWLKERVDGLVQAREEDHAGIVKLGTSVDELSRTNQLLENASQQQAQLSERHYEERVMEPLINGLLPTIHLLDEVSLNGNGGRSGKRLREIVEAVRLPIEQLFTFYGMELFRSKTGDPFDAMSMQPIQLLATVDQKLHQCVARSLRCGIRRQGRVLRTEMVTLFRYEKPQAGTGPASGIQGEEDHNKEAAQ